MGQPPVRYSPKHGDYSHSCYKGQASERSLTNDGRSKVESSPVWWAGSESEQIIRSKNKAGIRVSGLKITMALHQQWATVGAVSRLMLIQLSAYTSRVEWGRQEEININKLEEKIVKSVHRES